MGAWLGRRRRAITECLFEPTAAFQRSTMHDLADRDNADLLFISG
jgi:hypothetical protein